MKEIFVWCSFGLVFLWNICGSNSQSVVKVDNCTCKTSDGGIYSLWPLRRTDGKPRFVDIPGIKYSQSWRYAYNPCTPFNFPEDGPYNGDRCKNVALCKYPENDRTFNYHEIGKQKGFRCDKNEKGQLELAYKTNDQAIPSDIYSKVVLLCNESVTDPIFLVQDEDNYIFNLTHRCACKNRCFLPAPPGPTEPSPTSATSAPSPTSATSAPSPTSATAIPTTPTTTAPTTHPKTSEPSPIEPTTSNQTRYNTTSTTRRSQNGDTIWIYVFVALGAVVILITGLVLWKRHSIWARICGTDGERNLLLGDATVTNNIKYTAEPRISNLSNVKVDNDIVAKKKDCNKPKSLKRGNVC